MGSVLAWRMLREALDASDSDMPPMVLYIYIPI